MSKTERSKTSRRQLRAIGHRLRPVVTVAARGLSDAVMQELERALDDHELIKVKLPAGARRTRQAMAAELCGKSGAELLQSVGNVILILRRSAEPNPKLSNLMRV
ncbi:MAG: YhbY family RNA-binding protein [Halieaceae bacterium]|nr:YhbY family RNA-binding protein [Halieaceae bacterium]